MTRTDEPGVGSLKWAPTGLQAHNDMMIIIIINQSATVFECCLFVYLYLRMLLFICLQCIKDEYQALQMAFNSIEEKFRKTQEENQQLVSRSLRCYISLLVNINLKFYPKACCCSNLKVDE